MKGALSFDPGPIASDPPRAESAPPPFSGRAENGPVARPAVPREWLHGMELLGDRRCPRVAKPERWDQIIRDCWAIITYWAPLVIEADWSIENVFGFDPEGGTYDYGLAVSLRGGRLVGFTGGYALIRKGAPVVAGSASEYVRHHPRLQRGAPLLWTFDERKL